MESRPPSLNSAVVVHPGSHINASEITLVQQEPLGTRRDYWLEDDAYQLVSQVGRMYKHRHGLEHDFSGVWKLHADLESRYESHHTKQFFPNMRSAAQLWWIAASLDKKFTNLLPDYFFEGMYDMNGKEIVTEEVRELATALGEIVEDIGDVASSRRRK